MVLDPKINKKKKVYNTEVSTEQYLTGTPLAWITASMVTTAPLVRIQSTLSLDFALRVSKKKNVDEYVFLTLRW